MERIGQIMVDVRVPLSMSVTILFPTKRKLDLRPFEDHCEVTFDCLADSYKLDVGT